MGLGGAGAARPAARRGSARLGSPSLRPVADQIYNAIFIGSIYALFALGFTLVFSVLDILNLAHPALFTLGAFTALFTMQQGVPAALAVAIAFVVCGIAGVLLDRVAFAPLRKRRAPPLSAMISSIGVLYGFATHSPCSQMGLSFELKAFAVMIVGGMGSIPGAVLGAYLLSFGEIASLTFLPSELRDAFAYGLLFVVLLVRPSGILGQRAVDRV